MPVPFNSSPNLLTNRLSRHSRRHPPLDAPTYQAPSIPARPATAEPVELQELVQLLDHAVALVAAAAAITRPDTAVDAAHHATTAAAYVCSRSPSGTG